MKLEQQVATFELCRELKELEVKQESIFYWVQPAEPGGDWTLTKDSAVGNFSAYTVAELGEMTKGLDGAEPTYSDHSWLWQKGSTLVAEKTEADARAARLIHYIKKMLPNNDVEKN
jgi:hypothetical protein